MPNSYPQIAPLGTILGVWAHPDDESWISSGIMMAAIVNGQRVVCVTATHGELGSSDSEKWPHSTLGAVREKELVAALDVVGVQDHRWLDYCDGDCIRADKTRAVQEISTIIAEVRPDTILTFGPEGVTGHDDHKTVSDWTSQAVARSQLAVIPQVFHAVESKEWYEQLGKKWDEKFNVYFNIDTPPLIPEANIDLLFQLPSDLVERKLAALRAQVSQTEAMFQATPADELRATARLETFMRARLPQK